MRSILRSSPVLVTILALAACISSAAPNGALNGTWDTPTNPAGSGIEVQIRSSGASVTGTGKTYAIQHVVKASYTIKGTYENAVIDWSMSYDAGGSGRFHGHLVGSNTIQGTWTPPAPDTAYSVTLLRQ